jgi:large subunit ribosomal protein L25
MANIGTIEAQVRTLAGTGGARAVRREGRLPGVVYGGGKEPVLISVDPRVIAKEARSAAFFTKLYEMDINGTKERVLPKDLHLHVVKDHPIHIDFLRVSKGDRLHVSIPLVFINEDKSPGIKQGGMLNIVVHELELTCSADNIPESIEFDLTGRGMHQSIHLSDLNLPKDAIALHMDPESTVATIIAPSAVRSAGGGEGEEGAAEAEAEA